MGTHRGRLNGMIKATASGIIFLLAGQMMAQEKGPEKFNWPGHTTAAVCLTYDDGLDCHLDVAIPALDSHQLKGTFYCTGFSMSLFERVEEWRKAAADGHELGNHTLFHPCHRDRFDWVRPEYDLNSYTFMQLRDELRTANSLLKAIDGRDERSFAYTCSNHTIDGVSFIDSIRGMFPSARGGGPLPSSMNELDIHYVPSWGVQDPTGEELIAYVNEALEHGTVAVIMFHSVGGGYLNVSAEAHESLLDYLDKRREVIWTDTFLKVMNYVKAQSH
ncbi:MAG: polysaccharide deacetylase family protein [Bacteroidota bacterium]